MDDIKNIKNYISTLSRNHKSQFYIIIVINIFFAILDSGAIISTLNNYASNELSSIRLLALVMLLTTILRASVNFILSIHLRAVGKYLSRQIFEYIINYEYEEFISLNKKEIKNTVHYRINQIIHGVHTSIINIFVSLFSLPLFLISISIFLGKGIVLFFFPLILFLTFSYNKYKKYVSFSNKIADNANGNILEIVTNIIEDPKSLKIYNLENTFIKNYLKNDNNLKNTQATNVLISLIPRTSAEIIIYGFGFFAFLLASDEIAGKLISFTPILLITISRILPLLTTLNTSLIMLKVSNVALQTIYEYSQKTKLNPHKLVTTNSKIKNLEVIEYRNITYTYPKRNKEVIRVDSITLRKNSPLLITGPSGAGKSTLIDIMSGLLTSKKCTISTNNLKGSRKLNKNLLRRNSSYCGQTNFLIPGTLKENIITKDSRKIEEIKIYQLLEEFGLSTFSLNSIINDGKDLVSGGQKQRINIVRCLLEKRPLLFMDEPSSALDEKNVKNLVSLIDTYSNERLVAIISHDPNSFLSLKKLRIFDLNISNKLKKI